MRGRIVVLRTRTRAIALFAVAVLASAFVALLLAFTAIVAVTAIVVFVRFVARIVLLFGVVRANTFVLRPL